MSQGLDSPKAASADLDRRIAWVLEHPHTSDWLKGALRAALDTDPIAVANDVELLKHLLIPRASAWAQNLWHPNGEHRAAGETGDKEKHSSIWQHFRAPHPMQVATYPGDCPKPPFRSLRPAQPLKLVREIKRPFYRPSTLGERLRPSQRRRTA